MSNKMLIDATHPEETRVVVLRGNRVEEFDFEAADRQQLRGNIYLAKVTRVEPSLQAAFVEYGGNRHGFLAFSEIHPDYYQIPFADRQALIQEQAREEEEDAAAEDAAADEAAAQESTERTPADDDPTGDSVQARAAPVDNAGLEIAAERSVDTDRIESASEISPAPADAAHDAPAPPATKPESEGDSSADNSAPEREDHPEIEHDEAEHVESVGAEDALEEVPERRKPRPRQYKIQEVIKRRQVLLVQVVKEERGNKGAALTTYLSLAGRYSVLMPNTGRGGGISRKITNAVDRKRLKSIASELDVPEGMGVILRTAGANRTKSEVKRDFEYLLRLWENVRELTLRSTAPKLVYEEGSLIKRSIRDLYSREIEQVVVAGDDAYREAKDFMRMLMPSHARNVQQYRDDVPIFARSGVEAQLDAMFSPHVTLKSGGYIVINQTEALVSIDVNSGRSTREHSIEDTALNTNMEAAEEIARQLRLRDLAGLIVIDFIDMEEKRNNRSVERKLKDCLRADRARIQVGRISHFGLMEMSRQRIRTGVLESSTVSCPHCRGTGQVRSISSLSLQILRAVEDGLIRQSNHHLYVRTRPDVALYVLNQKRGHLAQLEDRFGLTITVTADAPTNGAGFLLERGAPVEPRPERLSPPPMPEMPTADEAEEADEVAPENMREEETEGKTDGESRDRRPRRRRRRGGADRDDRGHAARPASGEAAEKSAEADADEEPEAEQIERAERGRTEPGDSEAAQDAKRRRRGRRGGRRRGRSRENGDVSEDAQTAEPGGLAGFAGDEAFAPADVSEQEFSAPGQVEVLSGEAPPLEQAAHAQVDGIFGSDPEVPGRQAEPDTAGQTGSIEPARAPVSVSGASEPDQPAEAAASAPSASPTSDTRAVPGAAESAPPVVAETPDEPGAGSINGSETSSKPDPISEPVTEPANVSDDRPRRSGWWNRRSFL